MSRHHNNHSRVKFNRSRSDGEVSDASFSSDDVGNNMNELRLVLIGKTGSGKSATGNSILGAEDTFPSEANPSSVTKQCECAFGENLGWNLRVVETPGLYDTGMTKDMVTKEIGRCVSISSPGPHAIVFVTKMGRFTHEEWKTIQHFLDQFGEGMYNYLIVVFTGKDDLDYDGRTLEDFVEESPKSLRDILKMAGNRYCAFNNRLRMGSSKMDNQVQDLFDLIEEMVADNGGSCYTNHMYRIAANKLARKDSTEQAIQPSKAKAVIKASDMTDSMTREAIDCARRAIDKYSSSSSNHDRDAAAFVKKEFDRRHGPTWNCIVGMDFGSYVTHRQYVHFSLGNVVVLLFKGRGDEVADNNGRNRRFKR